MPRRAEIAERVVQALAASAASLPLRVAEGALTALGSSAAEQEVLARTLAVLFRSGVVNAVESTVTRALLSLGLGPDGE